MTQNSPSSRSRFRRPTQLSRPTRWARRSLAAGAIITGLAAPASTAASVAPVAASHAADVRIAAASSYPIVGVAPTPGGQGYWTAATNGGVFSYGNAAFHGSVANVALARPIVGIASTPDGGGYWLVASDGGIFTFGDAPFHGSTGAVHLNQPIVGMAPTPDGRGYWLVASDGGIFTFGDARFFGSTGNVHLVQPVIGMAPTSDGRGYWLVASDGGLFTFGDAPFHGSATAHDSAAGARSVGVVPVGSGYWIPDNLGGVAAFAAPQPSGAAPVGQAQPAPGAGLANPGSSVAPSPAQAAACYAKPVNTSSCDAAALADINSARSGEGLGPLSLPSNYASMSLQSQVLAVANAERTSRGLPAQPENSTLDSMAQSGAVAGQDPTGPSGHSWGSNISYGYPTALSADFAWMYNDGPGSPNIDCTSAGAAGCWGHRDNILNSYGPGSSGAGVYNSNGTIRLTELFVQGY